MNEVRQRYRKATGRPIMHGSDWCRSWKRNHRGISCLTSSCPHESHCYGLLQVYKSMLDEE